MLSVDYIPGQSGGNDNGGNDERTNSTPCDQEDDCYADYYLLLLSFQLITMIHFNRPWSRGRTQGLGPYELDQPRNGQPEVVFREPLTTRT